MSGVRGMRWGRGLPDSELEPCGTLAAYRRHLRRGDRIDQDCRQANARAWQDRLAAGYRRPPSSRRQRVHLDGGAGTALCGRLLAAVAFAAGDPAEATCAYCLAVRRRHQAAALKRARSRAA